MSTSRSFPLDALLMRLAQRLYTQGCVGIGAPDYPPRFYRLMTEAAPHYGEDWAFMGQYAWANHEVGKMDEGMDLAQRSLDINPSNGVAAHSVAHVYYEMSQDDEGGAFLSDWLEDYDRRSTYRVHLSWHQALFELAMGRYNQVLGWYERDIRPSVQDLRYAALADSASLVWRMKIYGDVSPPSAVGRTGAACRSRRGAAGGRPSATPMPPWPSPPPGTTRCSASWWTAIRPWPMRATPRPGKPRCR